MMDAYFCGIDGSSVCTVPLLYLLYCTFCIVPLLRYCTSFVNHERLESEWGGRSAASVTNNKTKVVVTIIVNWQVATATPVR